MPWYEGQTAVVSFVLALLALVAAVGTFAIRESWVRRPQASGALDVATAEGRSRVRTAFVVSWALCDAVGLFGLLVALGSSDASRATPFLLGAAALFAIHRPSAWTRDPERAD
jgi:F0F1-type ATP synthase membrane subunit c/vacuolar-type H+-ATPase subunit K